MVKMKNTLKKIIGIFKRNPEANINAKFHIDMKTKKMLFSLTGDINKELVEILRGIDDGKQDFKT